MNVPVLCDARVVFEVDPGVVDRWGEVCLSDTFGGTLSREFSTFLGATWFDPETGQGSGYRLGLGKEDGWGLFSVLEVGKWLIPTDTFFFGRTVHRQSYGRVIRDQHFTPRCLSNRIPFNIRTLGVADLGKKREEMKRGRDHRQSPASLLARTHAPTRFGRPPYPTTSMPYLRSRRR